MQRRFRYPFAAVLAGAAVAAGAAAAARESRISAAVDVSYGAFQSVDSVSVVNELHDPSWPANSFLELDLTGSYEGNICGDDEVAIELERVFDQTGVDEFAVHLRELALSRDRLELERPSCADVSHPRDFRLPIRLAIRTWVPDSYERVWAYHFRNPSAELGTLHVRYDAVHGWQTRLEEMP